VLPASAPASGTLICPAAGAVWSDVAVPHHRRRPAAIAKSVIACMEPGVGTVTNHIATP